MPSYDVEYFNKNTGRNTGIHMQQQKKPPQLIKTLSIITSLPALEMSYSTILLF